MESKNKMNSNQQNRTIRDRGVAIAFSIALSHVISLLVPAQANAQCNELISGLRQPIGTVLSNQDNLLVSENGTTAVLSGRISIVDPSGNRRTLLDGLPSAISDVGEPSGPHGILMRGRYLYVAIGTGDVGVAGPFPGTTVENPNGPSSPIFSSVLRIHFSANVEKTTGGFTLTPANQQALANGETLSLSSGGGDAITIQMIADFSNFVPFPLPSFPQNIQLSNPFDLVPVGDSLYVTDGGRNRVWQIDVSTGAVSTLVTFPNIPNPIFPTVGGPFLQAVPTGIASFQHQLLVALFRGAPFPTGVSSIEQVDPMTGGDTPFITGLTTAIDILPITKKGATNYLVLQYASAGPFFQGPGLVLRFDTPAGPPSVIASCLTAPTSMTLNKKTGTLHAS